jgi:serine phosphatase RsbU (regulator of sigma subunit)
MAPRGSLSGSLPQRLPVIVVCVGVLLALGAATLTLRLSQRRHDAERLADRLETAAGENRRLYAEQRGIAQTLQHALLPEVLPQLPGIETGARYEAGERGLEIGGDWYDVIAQGDQRLLLVVGDVSGRGLRAATTMASLRYAIRAYAAQQDPPATILAKLSRLVSVSTDGQLATVSCLLLDIGRHEINLTSAGHLPPLLVADGRCDFLSCEVGLPIGVDASASYVSRTIAIPRTGALLAFTDGLVERRGESLDEGLARLRRAAAAYDGELPALLNTLVLQLHHEPSEDDIAIVGLRWTS